MMDDDFDLDCSEDELKNCQGNWEPNAEEIVRLYNILDKDEVPDLNWKCPGYRSPSPEVKEQPEEHKVINHFSVEDKSDFDFMDEVTSPKLKIRKDGEDALKGSAKKKVTSLDGVINNMRRHNLLPPSKSKTNDS
ncbi:PREDICTED: PAXIP1-associated glutamate-rich protein 1 [Nicrophorus vespilloides]|uniref:PAXIP1-associated glutamate-rich protein 1 n=1 Tax=Nicrophorus vespilloides TaxID=110193 RepID=A0ABM1M2Z5_NICVS|nr:PREDICTED: PAXIP1-associated glutamate-rich protein 1 [Nicrophorus vespilloides]